jgi:hypothetical protein
VPEEHKADKREFRRQFLRAIYRGFERVDVILVILIVVAFLWNWLAGLFALLWNQIADYAGPLLAKYSFDIPKFEHDPFHPPGWFVATCAALFVAYELYKGAQNLYVIERAANRELRDRQAPRLEARDPRLLQTPFKTKSASTASISVFNPGVLAARRCSARLTEIRQRSQFGSLVVEGNHIRLLWSSNDEELIDIGPETSELLHIFLVVVAPDRSNRMFMATLRDTSMIDHVLKYEGDFSFVIEVVSENTPPLKLVVGGHFDLSTHSISNVSLQ